jgi:hypothetical protein
MPLLQRTVRRLVDRWPTGGKPLVAPQVQQKRTSEEDRLGARLGAPSAQAPVPRGQNRSTLVDLGHVLHCGVGDPPHMRDQEPRHRVSLGPTEHHITEDPQQVRLQVPVARLLVSVVPHERGLKKFKIQWEVANQYYEKTIGRETYAELAQPTARGAVGVGEVRHLWRAGTAHNSGEPREEDVAPRLGGSTAPMGSPEHGSLKRRATSSKVTAISPQGKWKLYVSGRHRSRSAQTSW